MSEIGFGLWMTVMGMGTVFVMLALLMAVLKAISWWDDRQSGKPAIVVSRADQPDSDTVAVEAMPGDLTPELVAAVTIAVLTHLRVRRGQAAPAMRQVRPGSHLFASRWVAVGRSYQNKPWK